MSAWRRPDGSFYFPPTNDPLDLLMQAQLRRIARTLGHSVERVAKARRESREGEHEEWAIRGRVAGHMGQFQQGHD